MNTITLTIPFASEAGDGESRWIRLEQVEIPDEGATLEQAAELIDALYGLTPCEDGLGNGGEESDEEELPEEADFLDMAKERLKLDMCDEGESATWDAEVDVLRSHQDDAYNLQGERVEVGETTPMSKTVTETVEIDGATYDLQWPCGGEVGVSAGEVESVKGSTVNFAAPVRGRVRISYRAVWDRVKLKVRRGAAASAQGGVSLAGVWAVSGGASKTANREEDAASVVAFWRDLAAECSLTRPPEDDQDIDRAEIERICNPRRSYTLVGDCWQTIERYSLCNCSGSEAPDAPEPEDVPAPCPEGQTPGTSVGVVRQLEGYVDCEGEDKEGLNTPEFFREHCCEDEPYSPLPRCRETRDQYRGGKEIEYGADYWKGLYGESVRLTAVTPEGGNCGELIKVWAVPEEIPPPPELPERLPVSAGQTFTVTVLRGGRQPFTWSPPAGVTLIGTAAYGFMGIFKANDTFKSGVLTLTDACGRTARCVLSSVSCLWDIARDLETRYSWVMSGGRFHLADLPDSIFDSRLFAGNADFPFDGREDLEKFHERQYPFDNKNKYCGSTPFRFFLVSDDRDMVAEFGVGVGTNPNVDYRREYVRFKNSVPADLLNGAIETSLTCTTQGDCKCYGKDYLSHSIAADGEITLRCRRRNNGETVVYTLYAWCSPGWVWRWICD